MCQSSGVTPSQLSLGEIFRALLARPDVDPGGPTDLKWLPSIKKCDTKSHEDLRRIIEYGWANSGHKETALKLAVFRTISRLLPNLKALKAMDCSWVPIEQPQGHGVIRGCVLRVALPG